MRPFRRPTTEFDLSIFIALISSANPIGLQRNVNLVAGGNKNRHLKDISFKKRSRYPWKS